MKQYKKNFVIKDMAKDKMEGRYGNAILMLLVSTLISSAVRFLINTVAENTMNSIYAMTGSSGAVAAISLFFDLLLLAAAVVLGVMNAGITLYFLNLACGMPASVRNLFYAFRTDSKKALIISGAMTITEAVCLWPCQYMARNYLNTQDGFWLAISLITLTAGLCIYIPVSLGIGLSFYLMFDFPQNSGFQTLSLCWRIMKGQRKRLFVLELGFLPLMILCIFSFGIGFLWLMPYMYMTLTYFFLDLMNPREG